MAEEKDVKNLPHYTQFKLQPLEFFRANIGVLDFLQMCVIKYVCRYKMKNGREDLLKARNYIDMMIEDWDKEHSQPAVRVTATEILKRAAYILDCRCVTCKEMFSAELDRPGYREMQDDRDPLWCKSCFPAGLGH